MEKLKVLDLFSGIGGFSYALEKTSGFETIGFCEIDSFCKSILNEHWPSVPIYEDIQKLTKKDIPQKIDVLVGGFPCQNISFAGKKEGILHGEQSSLWKEYARLVGDIRPKWVIIENVDYLRKNGLGIVLNDLFRIGYDAEWASLSATSVGYPHKRCRLFIISYPSGQRFYECFGKRRFLQNDEEWKDSKILFEKRKCEFEFSEVREIFSRGAFDRIRATFPNEYSVVSRICRVTARVPTGIHEKERKERIKALGNAIVPRIAEVIGLRLLEIYDDDDVRKFRERYIRS